MRIKWIKLQNVKSYLDETITFNEGVNFISGVNGAGKTTIIESIGYALFNSKPGNISEFLRYGQKTGIITIELEANDRHPYKIVRKFGNTNSWLVFDLETDSEVDLHGAADIVPFLKEILGIDPDQDSSQLYDDIIGISQGTFTAPFLESAAGRRDKFNRIFKVESYRAAFMKILSVIRKIEETTKELEIKKAENEGRIKDYPQIKEKTDEIAPMIVQFEKDVAQKKQQKEKAEKERDILRNREKEIQKTKNDIQLKNERIKNIDDVILKLGQELTNAKASESLVQKNQEGYISYINIKKSQESLEKQRKERDSLKDHLAKNETAYEAIKAAIDTENKTIAIEETDIKTASVEALKLYDAFKLDTDKTKIKLDKVQIVKTHNDKMLNSLSTFENSRNDISKLNVKLCANYDKWSELRKNIERIEALLLKEAELKNGVEKLKTLEEDKKTTDKEIALQLQTLENLKGNLQKTGDGKCPFLDASCRNIEGSLDSYFEGKIIKQSVLIEGLKKHENELTEAISACENVKGELLLLQNEKETLKNLNQQETKYSQAYKNEFRTLSASLIKQIVENLLQLSEQLHGVVNKYAAKISLNSSENNDMNVQATSVDSDLSDRMKQFKDECNAFVIGFEIYQNLENEAENPGHEKVLNLLEASENISEKAERLLKSGKQLQALFASFIDKEHQTRLSEAIRAGRDMANSHKQIEELKLRTQKLEVRHAKLKEDSIRLSNISAKKMELSNLLLAHEGLDAKISDTQKGLLANQEAYDTFMKHQTEAMKVTKIDAEITLKQQNLLDEKALLSILNELLAKLSTEYSEKMLQDFEKLAEQLNIELTIAQSNLSERQRELKELLLKLEQMDKLKKEISKMVEEISYYNNIRATTVFIRNILNRAGERISSVYREYLSNEANAIYREVSNENVKLEWREDYEVFLVDMLNERKRERCFRQLSGGEQMTAALAMRLGLLKQLSGVGIGFFDEPTTNLDGERRSNLAQIIPKVTGDFDQLFVISHDDSFDAMTDNIVQLQKDSGEGTKLA